MDSLSICIPTNRGKENLEKCLISIKNADKPKNFKFNVCISDNSLDFSKIKLVKKFKKNFQINYKFSQKKTNRVTNMIESVNLSNYDFIWLLGDDEILSKKSFINLYKIFTNKKKEIDFIFLNSSFIKDNQKFLSKKKIHKFHELIDPKISYDFMGAMFLGIFRRKKWEKNKHFLKNFKKGKIEFSKLENTFPHLIIFTKAFMFSNVLISSKIYTNNLIKNREWSYLWPLVQSIRIPEVLKNYRDHGLPFLNYFKCRNHSLRFFLPNALKILVYKKIYPISYFKLFKHTLSNLIYPNFYLSPLIFLFSKFNKNL